jgi:Protein of unknown function with PCYCGC motif
VSDFKIWGIFMKKFWACAAIALVTLAASAQWTNPSNDVPAYHNAAPTTTQPPLLSGKDLSGPYFEHQYQVTAYQMANKVPNVLYQMPCYCRCDRTMGHKSLHSCFEGLHGAECSTCMKEAVYAYQQTKKGRTPAQIRIGIEKGDFENIDLYAIKL